ncbi:hypothetical protein QQ008_08090 [Fulvivirgaceae bacterium BMA10]|uniref:Secreted protein n=1 Tax=Splendidivirga corallicola TaxID=3051826 RepID=A0ABT8KMQ9_9BACT|nr:hypothetical protein [Fulvivirgaceae bacterium BMA10]
MRNLLYLLAIIGLSLTFSGCAEDPAEEVKPEIDVPHIEVSDDEDSEEDLGVLGENKD